MQSPTTKLASFLSKGKRLSQASLELSSSRGVFGSRERERKKREKRENKNKTLFTKAVNENIQTYLLLHQKFSKNFFFVTKQEGLI